MDKMYIWAAIELADGAKIVLLICQEGKKLPWGFFENGPVRLAGIHFFQFQTREDSVRGGNFNMEIEVFFVYHFVAQHEPHTR